MNLIQRDFLIFTKHVPLQDVEGLKTDGTLPLPAERNYLLPIPLFILKPNRPTFFTTFGKFLNILKHNKKIIS